MAAGHSVAVVTSRQTYGDPNARLPTQETIGGVEVHRVRTSSRGRAGLAGRAVDYASFYVAASAKVRRVCRASDIVIAKTDPPLLSIPIGAAARRRGARSINWLQDLYPEIAVTLGVRSLQGSLGRRLAASRNRSLRRAAANVVIGHLMGERLAATGLDRSLITVIPNWADDEAIRGLPPEANPLRAAWGLEDKFVVGYSGNLGRAHEIETLLGAAEHLRDEPDIVFLFIGGGHLRGALGAEVQKRDLANFVFRDYQPREALSASLSVADVHWISLRSELEGLIVPSKFYGIAAAGRPIITVSALTGELATLVTKHETGLAVSPGDTTGFAEAILALRRDPERREVLGGNARALIDGSYSKHSAFQRWDALLGALANPPT